MQPIVKTLLKTYIFSTVSAICVNGSLYAYNMQGVRYDHVAAAVNTASGTLLLTTALLVVSLPSLFLIRHKTWKHPFVGFLLYYTGPLLLTLPFFSMKTDSDTQFFEQLTGLIYLGFSTYFYYVVSKGYRKRFGYYRNPLSAGNMMSTRVDPSE